MGAGSHQVVQGQEEGAHPHQGGDARAPADVVPVDMAGHAIVDDDACRAASEQEVIRRYYKAVVAEAIARFVRAAARSKLAG